VFTADADSKSPVGGPEGPTWRLQALNSSAQTPARSIARVAMKGNISACACGGRALRPSHINGRTRQAYRGAVNADVEQAIRACSRSLDPPHCTLSLFDAPHTAQRGCRKSRSRDRIAFFSSSSARESAFLAMFSHANIDSSTYASVNLLGILCWEFFYSLNGSVRAVAACLRRGLCRAERSSALSGARRAAELPSALQESQTTSFGYTIGSSELAAMPSANAHQSS
jgi:hypothetical protein